MWYRPWCSAPSALTAGPMWNDCSAPAAPVAAAGACTGASRAKTGTERGSQQNRDALRHLVETGQTPGIIAYAGEQPAGWCSIAPRESYAALERSRALAHVDDRPVWSITCFYMGKSYRRQGLMGQLIDAAVDYARAQGATVVEAYPTDFGDRQLSGSSGYMGSVASFTRAGFVEVARRPNGHIVMRYEL